MANVTRVRVELRDKKHNSKEKNLKDMLQEFKRQVGDADILHELKKRQFFESKSERVRRKRAEAKNRKRLEDLERKILAGERVTAPSGFVKKVIERSRKGNNKNKRGRNKR